MAKLKAPANCGGFSFEGVEFQVSKGFITVPDENSDAMIAAISHGFRTTGKTDAENDADGEAFVAQQAIEAQAAAAAQAEAEAAAQRAAIAEQDRIAAELVAQQLAEAAAKQ